MTTHDATVTATFRDANTRLEVSWALVNNGGRPLLALVRPLRHNDAPAPEAIYVRLADDGVVDFSLHAFSVPEGTGVATLDRIAAVPLAAGQRLEGKAQVVMPLKTHVPYRTVVDVPPSATRARVCIGVIDADAKFPVSARQPQGVLATYHDRQVVALQRIVCSAAGALPGR